MSDKKDQKSHKSAQYHASAESIPTKELMRAARKRDYEKAKAARRAEKAAEKSRKATEREEARSARDKELWAAMKRAKDLDTTGDE